MEITDRIKMIMKMNQLSSASFADKIGVQRSNMSHILTGRNKPSLDFIEKVLIHFPKVNAGWLISGQIQQLEEANIGTDVTNVNNENYVLKSINKSKKISKNSKAIVKIITIYEDFSFDEYKPSI